MPSDGAEASSNVSVSHCDSFVNTFFEKIVIVIEFCAKCLNSHKIHSIAEKFHAALD